MMLLPIYPLCNYSRQASLGPPLMYLTHVRYISVLQKLLQPLTPCEKEPTAVHHLYRSPSHSLHTGCVYTSLDTIKKVRKWSFRIDDIIFCILRIVCKCKLCNVLHCYTFYSAALRGQYGEMEDRRRCYHSISTLLGGFIQAWEGAQSSVGSLTGIIYFNPWQKQSKKDYICWHRLWSLQFEIIFV